LTFFESTYIIETHLGTRRAKRVGGQNKKGKKLHNSCNNSRKMLLIRSC